MDQLHQAIKASTNGYRDELLKIAFQDTAKNILNYIGEGIQEIPQLTPFGDTPGTVGKYGPGMWKSQLDLQAKNLGVEGIQGVGGDPIRSVRDLTLMQKVKPAWETLKQTAYRFRKPLAGAGTLGLGLYGGAKLLGGLFGSDDRKNGTTNVFYGQ